MSKENFLPALLCTINNSIGNKKNHFSVKELCKILKKKKPYTDHEKYAIDMIQYEATKQEIDNFIELYNIPKSCIEYTLSVDPYN